jgi:NNP family nitrate/nitrite transporter-like MFS transporter
VTLATFGVMGAAALGVISTLPADGAGGSFAAFIGIFVLLFAASGLGNGAVYRMIPPIFAAFHARRTGGRPEAIIDAQRQATKEAGAVVGFVSAIAAYGAFLVPKAFGSSLEATGGPTAAFGAFILYYATCLAVTWWFYARKAAGVHA